MSLPRQLRVARGDITGFAVDAIVNAANSGLLGGSGVDGAIHRAAGPGLLEECRALGGCPAGEARITAGHLLPARWVIHAVGPVWRGGGAGEARVLAASYRSALTLAAEVGARSIAFPAISCGVYGYPREAACGVAVDTVSAFTDPSGLPAEIWFACFDAATEAAYLERLGPAARAQPPTASS